MTLKYQSLSGRCMWLEACYGGTIMNHRDQVAGIAQVATPCAEAKTEAFAHEAQL